MNRKVNKIIIRKFITFLLVGIIFTFISCFISVNQIIKIANADDIISDTNQNTYLKLTTPIPELPEPSTPTPEPPKYKIEPIINWYDLQSLDGRSVLNSKIDVNQEYKFCIDITSDQGWDDIEYINITAWFDSGYDNSTYNESKGGNINMFLQYQNTTGIPNYDLLWPDIEVVIGSFTEKEEKNRNHNTQNSQSYNLTFSFIPNYQFRYAPSDGTWDFTKNAINDINSWNFEMSVSDNGEGTYQSKTTSIFDEFGVNCYSEIISVGFPSINGYPGENASSISNLNINTRSNTNYSLSVDLDELIHEDIPGIFLSKDTMWMIGGGLTQFMNFNESSPIYLYGSATTYTKADNDNIMKVTNNINYKCDIPFGQIPGNYYSALKYKINIDI